LEPGLIESLHRSKTENPTFEELDKLINEGKYQRIDEKYMPRYNREKLMDWAKKVTILGVLNSTKFRT
jgi:hypothetical protein